MSDRKNFVKKISRFRRLNIATRVNPNKKNMTSEYIFQNYQTVSIQPIFKEKIINLCYSSIKYKSTSLNCSIKITILSAHARQWSFAGAPVFVSVFFSFFARQGRPLQKKSWRRQDLIPQPSDLRLMT